MTISKILVATDLSENAAIAVRQGLDIARRHDAEMVLLHVGSFPERAAEVPPQLQGVAGDYAQVLKDQFDDARNQLAALRDSISGQGATVSQLLVDGYPSEVIAQVARESAVDLVVIGTHGQTGLRRFVMGSTAERVVRTAECNVLVARQPGDGPHGGYRRVLVPLDFSEFTEPTIAAAATLAAADGEIELFHSWQIPGAIYGADGIGVDWSHLVALRKDLEDYGQKRLGELADSLRGQHAGSVSVTLREHSPAVAIENQLRDSSYDLVVMGSHGRRGIKRWALGSVAEVTVRHAPCSVAVVHPSSGDDS